MRDGGVRLRRCLPEMRWFDPTRDVTALPPSVRLHGTITPRCADPLDGLHHSDPLAGDLGVLPPSVHALMSPPRPSSDARLPRHRAALRGLDEGLRALQMSFLHGAYGTFLAYQREVYDDPEMSPSACLFSLRSQAVYLRRADLLPAPAGPGAQGMG